MNNGEMKKKKRRRKTTATNKTNPKKIQHQDSKINKQLKRKLMIKIIQEWKKKQS